MENALGLQTFGDLFLVINLAVIIEWRSAPDDSMSVPVEFPSDILALARVQVRIAMGRK